MTQLVSGTLIHVLLVEDDPGDVRLTRESMKESKFSLALDVVPNGIEAMAFLRREGKYADASRPDLLLLDLNMPKKDGRQVLKEIKADPNLRHIPVVVLTTSESEDDITQSYDLGANCYVTKPVDLEQFTTIVQAIEHFWFTVVKLPPD